ncbi:GGDEF domain-containing protein [Bhargavaea cecembensis]|uniref:GGDEF domain-containing protein n=1 Tax=Bhargavaea cecembensis TaxID=394098 RepID=UPI00058D9D4B|nr:GGDEF domain-containing protein [Bhargavaea cecembensis]
MGIKGRISAVGVVILFNILRYFYYHVYLDLPFKWDFFVLTAVFLAVAWFGGHQYDRAEYLSRRDPLTGAFNRRSLAEYVHRLARQGKGRFAVILFDLDDFKQINDRFGHETGDAVLKNFAGELKTFIGKRGIIARWGGDEFLAVVRDPGETFKTELAFEATQQLGRLSYQGGRPVGVSFGIAVFPEDGADLEKLVDAADQAMYENKYERKV